MIRRQVDRLVDLGGRAPFFVLGVALALMAASWAYASKLELRSDFLELLPRDSPSFRAFEHQLGRVDGGATLTQAGRLHLGAVALSSYTTVIVFGSLLHLWRERKRPT